MLKSDVIKKLREPFAVENLRWKVQTNPKDGKDMAVVVVFVDARSVAAHLDDVVGGEWHTAYRQPPVTVGNPALECQLTICGVTRSDVGTVEPSKIASSDTKDLYSDALKRAAVQFGVGAFLYRFPLVMAKCEKFGNAWYLTKTAKQQLKELTARVVSGQNLPRYSDLMVRDYDPDSFESVTGGHADAQQPASTVDDLEVCKQEILPALADIVKAPDLDSLKQAYSWAFKRANGFKELQDAIALAKDKRKAELTNQDCQA